MATAAESILLTSASPGPATFKGGRYLVGCIGSNYGTVALQGLLPDGSTYATVPDVGGNAVSFSANGWKTVDLAQGQYKLSISSATGVSVRASSLPG